MQNFGLILSLIIILLGVRTMAWHLQCWQIREYRFDRLRAWLKTDDGKWQYFTPWFSSGILPRPKLSGRIFLILLITAYLSVLILAMLWLQSLQAIVRCWGILDCQQDGFYHWAFPSALFLIWERTLWLQVALAVYLSNIPVQFKKLYLFYQAGQVIKKGDPHIIRVGITGSYGKSSTKELLVHLLKAEFGEENVLFNPANENTEIAIARLIFNNKSFFYATKAAPSKAKKVQPKQKFLVIETGAYKKGEIATVAKMIQPQFGILTGLNQQHIELFGSIENTRAAKFELAEGTLQTVFFNGNNASLNEIFNDRKITAVPVPISVKVAQAVQAKADKTNFRVYGENFSLPWPGEFFVHNALLALELCREIGISPKNLAQNLKTLAPLKWALTLETHPQGFTLLRDLYSANPDGVLKAIEHLKKFSGKKIFVSIPLRELGKYAKTVHQQIFEKLKALEADVWWEKTDFSEIGKTVLGEKFHSLDVTLPEFKNLIKSLNKDDVILLESKLSDRVMKLFK